MVFMPEDSKEGKPITDLIGHITPRCYGRGRSRSDASSQCTHSERVGSGLVPHRNRRDKGTNIAQPASPASEQPETTAPVRRLLGWCEQQFNNSTIEFRNKMGAWVPAQIKIK